jgi:hypothetical protein
MILLSVIFYFNFRLSPSSSDHTPSRIFVITNIIAGIMGYIGLITNDHCGLQRWIIYSSRVVFLTKMVLHIITSNPYQSPNQDRVGRFSISWTTIDRFVIFNEGTVIDNQKVVEVFG